MGLLALVIAVVAILVILELFKHHFTKSLMKYMIFIIVFIFILLIVSAYVDFGSLIGKDSTFSHTGAVIAEGVSDDADTFDFTESETLTTISEKTKEFFRNIIDN